jgi:hypothetical protein
MPALFAGTVHERSISDDETAVAERLVGVGGVVVVVVDVALVEVEVALFSLFTVMLTAEDVPIFPAASYALVVSEWVPFDSDAVFNEKV